MTKLEKLARKYKAAAMWTMKCRREYNKSQQEWLDCNDRDKREDARRRHYEHSKIFHEAAHAKSAAALTLFKYIAEEMPDTE